ncbi:hypothetical protein PR048_015842 [Dryococelus australis]|uniref:Uncharacterized protein n=1 Tax=Dryococelus australis TaxID=614101 RepID=A0ABQ9HIL3_9NEOP|nr:hypothetical protein PR048_015842 [Dryococelus australis]
MHKIEHPWRLMAYSNRKLADMHLLYRLAECNAIRARPGFVSRLEPGQPQAPTHPQRPPPPGPDCSSNEISFLKPTTSHPFSRNQTHKAGSKTHNAESDQEAPRMWQLLRSTFKYGKAINTRTLRDYNGLKITSTPNCVSPTSGREPSNGKESDYRSRCRVVRALSREHILKYRCSRGRSGVVVRLLTSHLGEPGWNPGGDAPRFSHVGIAPDDAAGRRVFSVISRFSSPSISMLPHTRLVSPSSDRIQRRQRLSIRYQISIAPAGGILSDEGFSSGESSGLCHGVEAFSWLIPFPHAYSFRCVFTPISSHLIYSSGCMNRKCECLRRSEYDLHKRKVVAGCGLTGAPCGSAPFAVIGCPKFGALRCQSLGRGSARVGSGGFLGVYIEVHEMPLPAGVLVLCEEISIQRIFGHRKYSRCSGRSGDSEQFCEATMMVIGQQKLVIAFFCEACLMTLILEEDAYGLSVFRRVLQKLRLCLWPCPSSRKCRWGQYSLSSLVVWRVCWEKVHGQAATKVFGGESITSLMNRVVGLKVSSTTRSLETKQAAERSKNVGCIGRRLCVVRNLPGIRDNPPPHANKVQPSLENYAKGQRTTFVCTQCIGYSRSRGKEGRSSRNETSSNRRVSGRWCEEGRGGEESVGPWRRRPYTGSGAEAGRGHRWSVADGWAGPGRLSSPPPQAAGGHSRARGRPGNSRPRALARTLKVCVASHETHTARAGEGLCEGRASNPRVRGDLQRHAAAHTTPAINPSRLVPLLSINILNFWGYLCKKVLYVVVASLSETRGLYVRELQVCEDRASSGVECDQPERSLRTASISTVKIIAKGKAVKARPVLETTNTVRALFLLCVSSHSEQGSFRRHLSCTSTTTWSIASRRIPVHTPDAQQIRLIHIPLSCTHPTRDVRSDVMLAEHESAERPLSAYTV